MASPCQCLMRTRWMQVGVPSVVASCAIVAVVLAWSCGGAISQPDALQCDQSLWSHVYLPERLQMIDACRSMTGIVQNEHQNDDGDVDVRVTPDPQYVSLLNDANRKNLNGALQVEAVCQGPIKPSVPSAESACGDYRGSVVVPPVGAHVQVVGSYVLDTNHGWMEIHPVTRITIQ